MAGIAQSPFAVQRIDLLKVGILQLEVTLQVLLDSRWSFAFRNDASAVSDAPRKRCLCTSLVVLLADLSKSWVVNELVGVFALIIDLVLVSEGRVLGDMNALARVPVEEVLLG